MGGRHSKRHLLQAAPVVQGVSQTVTPLRSLVGTPCASPRHSAVINPLTGLATAFQIEKSETSEQTRSENSEPVSPRVQVNLDPISGDDVRVFYQERERGESLVRDDVAEEVRCMESCLENFQIEP